MANGLRRMPVPPKVNSFQAEIGRDQTVQCRPDPQHRTVIANSNADRCLGSGGDLCPARRRDESAKLRDELSFGQGHGRHYYTAQERFRPQ